MDISPISVLVVEDEALVRMNIVTELEGEGLDVLEAATALDAIAILTESPVIHVLFTDVDMPGGLDGLELAKIVSERYPHIRVIVTSGHRDVSPSDLPADSRFVPKPYISEKVVQTILDLTAPVRSPGAPLDEQ